MFKHSVLIIVAILLLTLTTNYAQGKYGEIGKFFNADEVKILYGKVIGSLPVDTDDLKEAVQNAKDYILFNIKNNKVYITSEKRSKLSKNSDDADKGDQMFFFSKSKVAELLRKAGDNPIRIERRLNNVNTLSYIPKAESRRMEDSPAQGVKTGSVMSTTSTAAAETTLEMSGMCPPVCWD